VKKLRKDCDDREGWQVIDMLLAVFTTALWVGLIVMFHACLIAVSLRK
jgi:hypothetical protein